MSDRASLEQEINETKKNITTFDRDCRQLRDWISSNERAVSSQPETLRRITEDGIVRARADLAQRENDMRRQRESLAENERMLAVINEIERKEREITALESEQERIVVALERLRSEQRQLKLTYEALANPAPPLPPCEIVLPTSQRIALDTRYDYTIGWSDATGQSAPSIDLTALGAGSLGVSRVHARMRCRNGQWDIEDLGSTNGTFLNESPLAPNTPTMLNDRTTIRLGNVKLFFHYVAQTTRLRG